MAGNPAELSRAHHGATRDLTNSITRLENFWRESLNNTESHINWTKTNNKMSIHRTEMYTDYGNIQRKKYNKSGHIHSSAKCCIWKCGQTHLLTKHTAYEIKTIQVASKDTFFKTPAHFGGVQGIKMSKEDALKIRKWRNFLWERWKWE